MTKTKVKQLIFMIFVPIISFMLIGIFSFASLNEIVFAEKNGGAIFVGKNSIFSYYTTLTGHSATNGGAVYVDGGGKFNMIGGSIYGNTATANGNNVYNAGTFTINNGTIGVKPNYLRVDKNGNKSLTGKYISFGSYPQTIKESLVTINSSNVDSNGYYLGSDGCRYAKVTANPYGDDYVFTDGNTITANEEYYFKVEPIIWRILSEQNGQAIILAENIIDVQSFYKDTSQREIDGQTIYANNYKHSDIRTWLNGSFYNKAFNLKEKNIIKTTAVNNSAATTDKTSNKYYCEDTQDNVWLLSYKDLKNSDYGFGPALLVNARKKQSTDYSRANHAYMSTSGSEIYNGRWWTRSPHSSYNNRPWVSQFLGNLLNLTVSASGVGVVPALTIQLNEEVTEISRDIYNSGTMNLYGGNVYSDIYSSSTINTMVGCNVSGIMSLSDEATITVENYMGAVPKYAINISGSRTPGPIITLKGNSTEPALSKFSISGYDNENCKLKTVKDASGNWTVSLVNIAIDFPNNWQNEIKNTQYMTTTITPTDLTSIKFVSSVPSGYTQIGTFSTGLPVYQGTTATEIAFVWEKIYAPSINYWVGFRSLSKLKTIEFDTFNTSKAIDISQMFLGCSALTSLNVSGFNTSKVTDMSLMFSGCSGLTSLNVSGFNTSKVTDMGSMFRNCSSLTSLDLSNFNSSNVNNMSYMFNNCPALTSLNLTGFSTPKVTNMRSMFEDCSGLTSLDVSSFDTSKVTSMWSMFSDCSSLTNLDLSGFDTSNVTDMSYMIKGCSGITSLNVSGLFNTSKVTDIKSMFRNCSSLTGLDVSSFNTSKVTDMDSMFSGCSGITSLNVSGLFNTSNVENMDHMFASCETLTSINLNNFNTSKVANMESMFFKCSSLTSLDLSSFDTSNVTNMSSMFIYCGKLTSLNVSSFNTSKVTNMSQMFSGFKSAISLNLSNFNTSNVANMSSMFDYSSGITSLNVSSFNTTKVTTMFGMFNDCSSLTSLNLSNFNMSAVTDVRVMLSFGLKSKLNYLRTPYNNTAEISILTEATFYNTSTGNVVTSVPANTTRSLTYSSNRNSSFIQGSDMLKKEYDICFAEIEEGFENSFDIAFIDNRKRYIVKNKRILSEE